MSAYQHSNSSNDEYVLQLLHRAIMLANQNARVKVQQCLCGIVRGWFHRHPHREALCGLDSEENYVQVAFERFWRVTIDQQIEFNTLASALQYLRVSLNETILDRLRASAQPKEVSLPWSGFPGEPLREFQESRYVKTRLPVLRFGNASKRSYSTFVSSDWLTCSFTVDSSQGRLSTAARRSSVTYAKSTIYGATS